MMRLKACIFMDKFLCGFSGMKEAGKCMKKAAILLFVLFMLGGCGRGENAGLQSEEEELTENGQEHVTDNAQDTAEEQNVELAGSMILEDEQSLYLCSPYMITEVDKETGESVSLWKSDKKKINTEEHTYSGGRGVLVDDHIYFIEVWMDESSENYGAIQRALSVICTDGSSYQRLEDVNVVDLFVKEGVLYLHISEDELYVKGYSLSKDGNLIAEATIKEKEEEEMLYYLVDRQTMEMQHLTKLQWNDEVIAMDKEYVYLRRGKETADKITEYRYEKINIKTGDTTLIFSQEPFVGLKVGLSSYMADTVLQNGYIYYVGIKDYKLYIMRRNLENPDEEEVLGEAFYDSRISEIGTVDFEYAEFFEDGAVQSAGSRSGDEGESETTENLEERKDEPCATVDLEWLVVDERYPGASKINSYMKEIMDDNISYEKGIVDEVTSLRREYSEDFPPYSLSSNIYEIGYICDTYLSYCQAGYEYYGGAHGMPYRIGYTFNLQTGELLALSDVIDNSEEELKEIVGRYFEELISKDPENYWEGSVESVKEWTDLDSDYYLTEEGIRFYQTPYAISSYAAGFPEVTIPYSEFLMKIEIG